MKPNPKIGEVSFWLFHFNASSCNGYDVEMIEANTSDVISGKLSRPLAIERYERRGSL
jgi:Ni,Fe-hydrogenase III small subunit